MKHRVFKYEGREFDVWEMSTEPCRWKMKPREAIPNAKYEEAFLEAQPSSNGKGGISINAVGKEGSWNTGGIPNVADALQRAVEPLTETPGDTTETCAAMKRWMDGG